MGGGGEKKVPSWGGTYFFLEQPLGDRASCRLCSRGVAFSIQETLREYVEYLDQLLDIRSHGYINHTR
jgi:hypothetical protein